MVAASIVGLVFAYLVIDVFDNLKWFNQYGSTADEIARYYGALPVLVGRVIPMALLIAVALTISLIGANGSYSGCAPAASVFRVLAPVWLLCGLAVPAYHLLSNEVVPRATAEAGLIKRDIKNQDVGPVGQRERVWYRVGPRICEMERLDLFTGRASNVTLYDLGGDGFRSGGPTPSARSVRAGASGPRRSARRAREDDRLRRPKRCATRGFGEKGASEIRRRT